MYSEPVILELVGLIYGAAGNTQLYNYSRSFWKRSERLPNRGPVLGEVVANGDVTQNQLAPIHIIRMTMQEDIRFGAGASCKPVIEGRWFLGVSSSSCQLIVDKLSRHESITCYSQ